MSPIFKGVGPRLGRKPSVIEGDFGQFLGLRQQEQGASYGFKEMEFLTRNPRWPIHLDDTKCPVYGALR